MKDSSNLRILISEKRRKIYRYASLHGFSKLKLESYDVWYLAATKQFYEWQRNGVLGYKHRCILTYISVSIFLYSVQ